MKRKIFVVTSIILIIGVMFTALVGCKSAAEKEKEYYDKCAATVEASTERLASLTDEVFNKSWTSSFVLATTYYKTSVERKYKDGREEKFVIENPIKRGSKEEAGWPVKEVVKDDYTEKNSTDEYVTFAAFDVDYNSKDDYTIKTTVFEEVEKGDYIKNISKKNYREKFTVKKELEYTYKDGVESGELYVDPISIIKSNTNKEDLRTNGVGASDNFRIYTHFMRIESRKVFGADGIDVTRDINDASVETKDGKEVKKYWNNFGDDITYNWNNVYAMNNNRLTVLYSKGKNRINSLEIYNEGIISYYTKNNNVDTSLVLKADVIRYMEMVVEFKYDK